MLIFILYIIIASILSDIPIKEIFHNVKKYWYYLPIFIIYKYIKKEYISYAISSFLLGMFVSELISYGIIFSLWKVRLGTPTNPSMFLHHIQYSIFLSFSSIVLFFNGLNEKDKKIKIIYFLFFTTITTNLFFNVGRTGYITFLAGMIISLGKLYKLKFKTFIILFLSITAILLLFYEKSPNFNTRVHQGISDVYELKEKKNYDTSIGARIALWIAAKNIFTTSPILGVGASEHIHKKDYFARKSTNEEFRFLTKIAHFHNSFLEILLQYGIIGLSLFIYILYLISKIPIIEPKIKMFKISILVIFILGSFTDRLFYINSTMSLFALICGLIFAQYKFENTGKHKINAFQ
jgi:O-antigen ligase